MARMLAANGGGVFIDARGGTAGGSGVVGNPPAASETASTREETWDRPLRRFVGRLLEVHVEAPSYHLEFSRFEGAPQIRERDPPSSSVVVNARKPVRE